MQEHKELTIAIDDHLVRPGDFFETSGTLELEEYKVGEHKFTLPQGIQYTFRLTQAGEGILLEGNVSAKVDATCDLCLQPTTFTLSVPIATLYLFHEVDNDVLDASEDDIEVLPSNHKIELSDIIVQSLILETPFVITCKPDCAGLCPACGKDLNDGPCLCTHESFEKHPFAKLADLKEELEKAEHKRS